MLETKIRLLEDRPDLIVIKESFRPWEWGGFSFNLASITSILVFLVMMVGKGNSKVLFERAYQAVTLNSGILFSRKQKTVQFAEIEKISLSPCKMTRAGDNANPSLATLSLDLGELLLTLSDKSSVKIATAYWSDKEIRVLGKKIAELLGKPFIINERNNP
jgi:hypothetical protein